MKRKSFTLIEMLIVIVIIGILAAALVPRLQAVQARARDTQRKTDLQAYNVAFEIYRSDNNMRPPGTVGAFRSSIGRGDPWLTGLSAIMTSLPLDPKNNAANPWVIGNYSYAYLQDVPSKKYSILTQLENRSDPERSGLNPGRGYFYVGTCDPWINYHHYIYEGSPFKQCQP